MRNIMNLLVFLIAFSFCPGCYPKSCSVDDATALSSCIKTVPDSEHFYFVQITDTHLGDGDHIARVRHIVKSINNSSLKPAFVVHTGDILMDRIMDPSAVNQALAVFNDLKMPVYFVAGNHDILRDDFKVTEQVFEKQFGGLITTAKYGGVTFLFIYTEPLKGMFSGHETDVLKKLETLLKAAGGAPVVICHHRPCVDDFYLNKMHKGWKAEFREKWIQLINEYHVKAVIAGHFHRDEHHWLGEVPLYVSSSVAGYWGRQATYRIYEYKNGKINYRTQYVE